MVWEERYLFLDEFYGGIGLFFVGLASQNAKNATEMGKKPKLERQKQENFDRGSKDLRKLTDVHQVLECSRYDHDADDEQDGAGDNQKETELESSSVVRQRKHRPHRRKAKISTSSSPADEIDKEIIFNPCSKTAWLVLFYKCISFLNIFTRIKLKYLQGLLRPSDCSSHDSVPVLSEKRESSSSPCWLRWYYEKESMIPEPESFETNPTVLCEKENVNPQQLQEYLSIEPRMRCHHHADSLFSTSSGFTNYRGVLNWLIVLSLCSMGRTALENVIKYGILINPFAFLDPFIENPHEWRCLRLLLLTNIYIMIVFWMERLLSNGRISERLGLIINSLTLTAIILVPGMIVFITHPNPFFSSVTLSIQTVTFLKLVSYVQVNKWCRDQRATRNSKRKRMQSTSSSGDLVQYGNGFGQSHKSLSRELVSYPLNLTLADLYYFMFTPTLCYELNFPRSERIRKRFLTKRILEMIFLVGVIVGLVQQWIVPLVHNSRIPFKELDFGKMLERLLKLAVPNHIIWLLFFYWMFHSCLNTIAEIMRFGDRVFYRDWWNASNIREFWQNWNIPVHRWAIRHLYKPMVTSGYSPGVASIAVFCVSAFFHEYLVSVPLKMFRLWAFMAMLGQVPLAYLTKYMDQKTGNIVVWLSLIIGQPAALLMYYHDYYLTRTMSSS